ncbi:MAG: efflux RND transporter periplasmic adaptor subunit [Cyanobacteria bacterium P01_A01_bin.123]
MQIESTAPNQSPASAGQHSDTAIHEAANPTLPKLTLKRWQLWGLLPLLLLPVGAIATNKVLSSGPSETAVTQALPVETLVVQPVDEYSVDRSYSGELAAGRSSELGFELGGKVVEILVDEGDAVNAGQPLARLDTRSLQAQRQQLVAQRDQAAAQLQELQAGPRQQDIAAARAAVADLQNQVDLGRLQETRRQDLYDQGAISREELDQQTFGTGSLESRLQQAQSNLDELLAGTRQEQISAQSAAVRQLEAAIASLDIDLSKSVLTAPFNGRVSQRLIDEGAVVSSGQSLLKLVEGDTLEARIGVPTEVATALPIGSPQQVIVGDRALSAIVTAQLPEVDATSRTVTIVLDLQTDTPIPVGQTIQLSVTETQTTKGFWLPSTALVPAEQGLWSVYVAKASPQQSTADNYTVSRQDVEVMHTQGDRVLVRGTLQPGDRAITSGTHRIVAGQVVSVLR